MQWNIHILVIITMDRAYAWHWATQKETDKEEARKENEGGHNLLTKQHGQRVG